MDPNNGAAHPWATGSALAHCWLAGGGPRCSKLRTPEAGGECVPRLRKTGENRASACACLSPLSEGTSASLPVCHGGENPFLAPEKSGHAAMRGVPRAIVGREPLPGVGESPSATGGWRRLPKRLGAVTVGCKRRCSWHLASGGQWLGIGWAPWRGGGGAPPLPTHPCLPRLQAPPPPLLHTTRECLVHRVCVSRRPLAGGVGDPCHRVRCQRPHPSPPRCSTAA